MSSIKTHYDNLQVARNASPEVIRAAYKGLTQRYHPDRNPNDRERCERVMKIINRAFEVLSDPQRRAAHDAWIAEQGRIAHARDVVDTRAQRKAETDKEPVPTQPTQADHMAADNAASYAGAAEIFRSSRTHRDVPAQGVRSHTGPLYYEYQPSRPPGAADRIAAAREAYRAERRNRLTSQEVVTPQMQDDRDGSHAPSATFGETVQAFLQSRVAQTTPYTLRQVPRDVAPNEPSAEADGGVGTPLAPPTEPIVVAGGNSNACAAKGGRWAGTTMQVFGVVVVVKLFFAFKSNQFRGLVEAVMVLALGLVCAAIAFGLGWASARRARDQ